LGRFLSGGNANSTYDATIISYYSVYWYQGRDLLGLQKPYSHRAFGVLAYSKYLIADQSETGIGEKAQAQANSYQAGQVIHFQLAHCVSPLFLDSFDAAVQTVRDFTVG
jgi:hypothetical protein